MNTKALITLVILSGLLFSSCNNNQSESNQTQDSEEIEIEGDETISIEDATVNDFAKQGVDDELADKIKDYLTTEFMTEGDLRAITEDQRKFQLYKVDLNKDGNEEVFVNFITPYFCGTGGCTVLLLNSDQDLITGFSPTRTLYVEETLENDWRVILTKTEGAWRKLIYENSTYPSNPSMVETTNESPSDNAEKMFDAEYSKSKTYNF